MLYIFAIVLFLVEFGLFRTGHAFHGLHIEQRSLFFTFDAFLSVEERSGNGTVGNVVVLTTSLIILFN